MARRANFINDYGKAKPEQRVRMIFLNYQAFPNIILGYEQKIIIRIMDELNRAHREEIGDLGVRVQGGGIHSSPAEKFAIAEVTIEAAIRDNYPPADMLVDAETADEHVRVTNILYMMRRDLSPLRPASRCLVEEMGRNRFIELARDAEARYQVRGVILCDTEAINNFILENCKLD